MNEFVILPEAQSCVLGRGSQKLSATTVLWIENLVRFIFEDFAHGAR